MPVIDLNEVKKETKLHEIWRKAGEWVDVHKDEIAVGAAILGPLSALGVKWHHDWSRARKAEQEQFNKERFVYDRSLGMYLKLRRKLTNNDYIIINQRKAGGEKLSDILASMNLLE